MLEIVLAHSDEHIEQIKKLLADYGLEKGNANSELRSLERELLAYFEPGGCLLLALFDGVPAGCVAIAKDKDGVCEMRHMYIAQTYRGKRVGVALIEKLKVEAELRGYHKMHINVCGKMLQAATPLYRSLGFTEAKVYKVQLQKDLPPHNQSRYFELHLLRSGLSQVA